MNERTNERVNLLGSKGDNVWQQLCQGSRRTIRSFRVQLFNARSENPSNDTSLKH